MNLLLSPLTCLLWIVVGGVAGSLAHQIMSRPGSGFVQDVILGLIGAVVGGFILGLFHLDWGGSNLSPIGCCGNLVVATFGACVLIGIGRLLSQANRPT